MNPAEAHGLLAVRERIDEIDARVQELITERAKCALEVARIKKEAGETSDFYRPEREMQIINDVLERNSGPLPDEQLVKIFREIMSACLGLQHPLKIAFLGPEGTFTQMAAIKHFGSAVQMLPFATTDAVFREVESGAANFAVLPVENSTEGVVTNTLDRLMHSPLYINGEISLKIHQNLVGRAEKLTDIRCVYSHQQGLAQARAWLDSHLPHVERVAVNSTAEAARLATEESAAAAIAGKAAADHYQLPILAARIEDDPANITRFLVIGSKKIPPSGRDKTSILVANVNQPGGLFRLLEPIARLGVDMSRIESRPSRRGTWDYVFFIDMIGHKDNQALAAALDEISKNATLFRILGSYPQGSDL